MKLGLALNFNKRTMKKKTKAGRPKMDEQEKRTRIPITAKVKHHDLIVEKFEPAIERYEKKLEKLHTPKEVKQWPTTAQ